MKKLALALLLLLVAGSAEAWRAGRSNAPAGWNRVNIGGGGFVTGMSFSDDGTTRYVRTDTYGDYRWNDSTSQWDQMLTYQTMNAAYTVANGAGRPTYEVVVAPSDPNRVYRLFGGLNLYKSTNRGDAWSATGYTLSYNAAGGSLGNTTRLFGKYLAVDPVEPDVLLAGSYIDIGRISTDGAANFADLAIPPPTWNGYKVNGAHSSSATTIAVDTGTAGIPTGSIAYFAATGSQQYTVTTGLASGSGNIIISPGLTGAVAGGDWVKSEGGTRFAYDRTVVSGGRTQIAYAAPWGGGVWRTADAGATWTSIGGSLNIKHIITGPTGVVYTIDNTGGANVVQRYIHGAGWTVITPAAGSWSAIAADPNNANRIVVNSGFHMRTNLNQGTGAWTSMASAFWGNMCQSNPPYVVFSSGGIRAATDAPWLAWTNECAGSLQSLEFDPVLPASTSRLWGTEGIGVWYFDFNGTNNAPTAQPTWTSQTKGIENLVSTYIVSPWGGSSTGYFVWDRSFFNISSPSTFPSVHGPNDPGPFTVYNLAHGYSGDYVAGSPSTIVGVVNFGGFGSQQSGISTDGGVSWTKFATIPSNVSIRPGGTIAASTALNLFWCPSNNGTPSYTLDGGSNWTLLTSTEIPGLPADGTYFGLNNADYWKQQSCAADRVQANTFYFHSIGGSGGAAAVRGTWRSSDGGQTWTRIYTGLLNASASNANSKLRAVPGQSGHLFYSYGWQGGWPAFSTSAASGGALYRATGADTAGAGALTWTAIANTGPVNAFGFGAIAPGGDYPTVYMAGSVSGVYGIWRGVGTAAQWAAGGGTGTGVTWTNLTPTMNGMPLGHFDYPNAVEGDGSVYGKVYISFSGSGAMYYSPLRVAARSRRRRRAANDNSPMKKAA